MHKMNVVKQSWWFVVTLIENFYTTVHRISSSRATEALGSQFELKAEQEVPYGPPFVLL